MKKTAIFALLAAAALCTGCRDASSVREISSAEVTTTTTADTTAAAAGTTTSAAKEESSAADTTKAPETTKTPETTKAPESSEAPADTTKAAENSSSEAELTVAQAKEVMAALQKVDSWGATLIDKDTDAKTEANGTAYYKVTDPAYKSTDDVRKYMNDHMTEDFIKENYNFLLGGDTPFFIDANGALYVQNYPRGYKYIFTDTEPTLEHTMTDGYTVYAFISDMGADQAVLLFVNRADGAWKLSGISFGM